MNELTVEEMYAAAPLVRFSAYSQMQGCAVRDFGVEILQLLDINLNDGDRTFEITNIGILQGRFWLWVLGAYEVVRTMDQHSVCFSDRLAAEVATLKRKLAVVRMPFAKQEIAGRGKGIQTEGSISGVDTAGKDLHFHIDGETISMRALVKDFIALFVGIQPDDVRGDIREAQARTSTRGEARQGRARERGL